MHWKFLLIKWPSTQYTHLLFGVHWNLCWFFVSVIYGQNERKNIQFMWQQRLTVANTWLICYFVDGEQLILPVRGFRVCVCVFLRLPSLLSVRFFCLISVSVFLQDNVYGMVDVNDRYTYSWTKKTTALWMNKSRLMTVHLHLHFWTVLLTIIRSRSLSLSHVLRIRFYFTIFFVCSSAFIVVSFATSNVGRKHDTFWLISIEWMVYARHTVTPQAKNWSQSQTNDANK